MARLTAVILLGTFSLCYVLSIPLTLTGVKCIANDKLCANSYCNIKTIRKRLSVMNFQCFFPQDIEVVTFTAGLYKKNGEKYQKFLLTSAGNMCDVLTSSTSSPLVSRLLPTMRKYGFNLTSCPVRGLLKVDNYPLDLSFFPSIVPQGDFKLSVNIFEGKKNDSVILTDTYFKIKY